MRSIMRLLVLLGCLMLPAMSLAMTAAMEPLPRIASAPGDAAISAPLHGLLDDYLNRLPAQTTLNPRDDDGALRSWSAHRDLLARACQAEKPACVRLLQAQLDALAGVLQNREPRQALRLREVVVLSAMTDLCQMTFDMGPQCFPRNLQNMALMASVGWSSLGYHHLFLAYRDIDLSSRAMSRHWLLNDSKYPADRIDKELKELERSEIAVAHEAHAFELNDSLSGAFVASMIAFTRQYGQRNHQGMLESMANLARLASLQGNGEQTDLWWQSIQLLLAEHPELTSRNECLLQSQRFIIDIEAPAMADAAFDAPQRLQSLIDRGCPFTSQAVHHALHLLKGPQSAQALDTLQRAHAACERTGGCGYTRSWQIKMLMVVAKGEPASLSAEAQYWSKRLQFDALLGTERQIVWALAERLRSTGDTTAAADLYRKLDDHIDFRRSVDTGDDMVDLARYNELKRMRVLTNVQAGTPVALGAIESLRGQNLLRRLRAQRFLKDFAGAEDEEGRAEHKRQLAQLHLLRSGIEKLPADSHALGRAISMAVLSFMDAAENRLEYQYLNQLAAKKQNVKGDYFRESWALMNHDWSDKATLLAADAMTLALDKHEAYLSWMRVPGGYVGSLLAVDFRNTGPGSLPLRHSLRQQFIPFSRQDEAMLQLYRELLSSGSSIDRGVKLTAPVEADQAGLTKNGLPIWQKPDGGFAIGRTAPAGGKRIKNFSSLSDALFDRLLAPFAGHYQDARRLMISPDGALAYLSFETLTRQGAPVLESIDIAYVQSLAVYAELKKRSASKSRQAAPRLLSVANPLYAPASSGADRAQSDALGHLERLQWEALPGTLKESAALTKLYKNNRQLLGKMASKHHLEDMQKQGQLKDFGILHFATHGYVDDERSALVLSPTSSPNSTYLMDQEILKWSLDSDLVLLSACNTGIGRLQQGEGIVGLPYAFFMAGNINTLMSLWPVDDSGTAALIPDFMKRIQQGEDHVTALNNTKRAFARGEHGPALKNPRVWAAFVMYGVPLTAASAGK